MSAPHSNDVPLNRLVATMADLTSVTVTDSRFGALGDGVADDTAAIQAAVDWVGDQGGGEVYVPAGTYMIKAHVDNFTGSNVLLDEGGIGLRDGVHLRLADGATLKAITNGEKQYVVVRIFDKRDVTVSGGTIEGERHTHTGTGGEWGYGIAITGGSNIHLENVRCIDFWGDGVDVQQMPRPNPAPVDYVPEVTVNLSMHRVICSGNRRQGLSIEGVINMRVVNCTFENTHGTAPQCGVDIEPYWHDQPCRDILFEKCTFRNNASAGLFVMQPQVRNVTVRNCLFDGNGGEAQARLYSSGEGYRIEGCRFINTPEALTRAMYLQGGPHLRVIDNVVDKAVHVTTADRAVSLLEHLTISGNKIGPTLGGVDALYIQWGWHVTIENNVITDATSVNNGSSGGIRIGASQFVRIVGNTFDSTTRGCYINDAYTGVGNTDVEIAHNTFIDNRIAALQLGKTSRITMHDNLIHGAAHDNASGPAVYIGLDLAGWEFCDNEIHQAPYRPDTTGADRPPIVLSGSLETLAVGVTRGNTIYPEAGESMSLIVSGATPTTGYYGGRDGVMRAPLAKFPTVPSVGMQVFDTTGGTLRVWNGTAWKATVFDGDPRLADARTPKAHRHDWGEIDGVPTEFPPSTHTHTTAQVTGLQAELDGKASAARPGVEVWYGTAAEYNALPTATRNAAGFIAVLT